MRLLLVLTISFAITTMAYSQPSGYYNNTQGESSSQLKKELHKIIRAHTKRSYSQLWSDFQTTDKKSNGKVWDMYSDVPGGTPSYEHTYTSTQCGSYSSEGDCYNREHSFPKSWWGGSTSDTMYTDLFHLVPTDGYVNYKRSAYPYGEVGSASWTSTNSSKVGNSNYPGYSGTVFEPIDDYKGDFARNYFYMATRYLSKFDSWAGNTDMLDGNGFSSWALNLLLDWHQQDPVSQKEIDRNDDIYGIQHNRNPFIDHPEFVHKIWGGDDDFAPIFYDDYPKSDNIAASSFDLLVSLDESSTAYYVVLSNGASAPTSAQVAAGKDASGTLVSSNLRGSINVANSNTEYSKNISSLSITTDYDVYIVADDNASPSNLQSSPTKIDITTGSSGSSGSTYSENFDIAANWSGGSGYTAYTYTISSPTHSDYFSTNNGLRESSENKSAPYSWRLKNTSTAYLRYECKGTVSSFSIWAARWDNSPKPIITVRYSTNSGSTYSTAFTFDGDDFSGDKVFKQFSHTFASAITNGSGDKIYIEFVTNSGERMLYDDFEITFGGGSSTNSTESNIVKKSTWNEPTDINYSAYSAINTLTTSNSIEIAKFTINDGGNDNTDTDTKITKLTDIELTIDNWENIAAIAIFEGSTNKSEITSVNSSTVSFASISGGIEAADEGIKDFSVYATFKSTVTDNDNLKTTFYSATSDNSGSGFSASDAGGATTDNSGNKNKIVVSADHLAFTASKPPNSVNTNTDFEVKVEAIDANDNKDLDASNSISIAKASGTGTLSSATGLSSKSLSNGVYLWTDVQYNTAETFTISASASGLTSATSSNISASSPVSYFSDLIITEYIEGSSNNKYLEIWNNTGATVNLSNYKINIYANGSSSVSNSITLTGSLIDQDEYIIAHSSATVWSGTPDLSTGSLSFNGNDAVVLVNTNAKGDIDIIGTVGSSSIFAQDKTIRRNGDVSGPTTTYNSSDWTDYSIDDVSGLDNSGPLPIGLTSFRAIINNNIIIIKWQTATEENNDFFTIERSYNTKDFEAITELKGAGNSNTTQEYMYIDKTADLNSTVYYRLKQTDFDGKYSFSSIISINSKTEGISELKAYVNNNNLNISINTSMEQNANIELIDITGRIIFYKQLVINQGLHNYQFALPKYSSGIYFLRIYSNASAVFSKNQKLIIQ